MGLERRYGPWAIIAGASEGTGLAFARQIAAEGINCVLIARREGPLHKVADQIRREQGVDCIAAAIDLAGADASDRIVHAVGDREVGLYISNAGADPYGSLFLDNDIAAWTYLINRNILTTVRCCHHFGQAMRARGRGGILFVGSGACYGSGPNFATYSGLKAFDLCFAEGLWSELNPHGVDVLFLALSAIDTPALRRLLAEKEAPLPPNLADPEDVAAMGLARLPMGPVQNWGLKDDEAGYYAITSAAQRRARVRMIMGMSNSVFAGKKTGS